MLAAEAERLADLTELAARCSECFARAQCAGCDLKAIAPLAKAALALGAPQEWLYPDAPPCRTDAEYLDEAVTIRVAIRLRGRQPEDLIQPAVEQAEMAARAMRAALMARPPYYAAYAAALSMYQDAVAACDICLEARERLIQAHQYIAAAAPVFADTYYEPEQLAASGGVLPYRGRWIVGAGHQ